MPPTPFANANKPLTCAHVVAECWAFADGLLSPSARAAMQAHLDTCPACRLELERCRSLETTLRSGVTQIPPAGDLRSDFYARLASERARPRRTGWFVAVPAFALGLLALLIVHPDRPHTDNLRPSDPTTVGTLARSSTPAPATDAEGPSVSLRSVPGLSEAEANRLLVQADKPSARPTARPILRSHRVTLASLRLGTRKLVASASHPAAAADNQNGLVALRAGNREKTLNRTAKLDTSYALALNGVKAEALRDDLSNQLADANLAKENGIQVAAKLGAVATTSTFAENGVSLQVADEVRGFTNSTRVASDVTLQDGDGTIHIEADGN